MSSEFWSSVEKTDACWNWLGSTTPDGYGRAVVDGKRWWAHRYAYTTIIGVCTFEVQIPSQSGPRTVRKPRPGVSRCTS